MRRLALALAVLVPLAGCVAPAAEDLAPAALPGAAADVWAGVRARLDGVPCEAPVDEGTSANVVVLAEDALDGVGGTDHGEADHHGDVVAVARHGTGGVVVVDVGDPLAPVELAAWDPETPDRGLDVKFSADGRTVFVAGDRGVHLVDVTDPRAPREASFTEFARPQAHMVTPFVVGGTEWLAVAKGGHEDLRIYRVDGAPEARVLVEAASPKATPLGADSPHDLTRTHDAWFEVDPRTGTPTLWLANVWHGVTALDVTDPADPKVWFTIPNLDPWQGYTHTVQVYHPADGRRLVVAVQEVGANALKVWDATDPAAVRLVAVWHVPVTAKPQHNLQVVGDRAYVAHYDEGVYVFDLRDVEGGILPTRLAPVAHLAAGGGAGDPGNGGTTSLVFGGTWDVLVKDGLLYTSEISGGLRVAGYGCLWPGDATATSRG